MIWLLVVITPLVVSARRGLSPGVVICCLLWIIGLISILAARRRGRSWDGGLWRYASFRLTVVMLLVIGQLLIFFGSSFSVAFFLMMAVFPALQGALDESYQHHQLHRKVMGVAHSLSLPAIDLTKNLAAVDPDAGRWQAAPWDAHPNVEAHALLGRAMAEAVEKLVGAGWRKDAVKH